MREERAHGLIHDARFADVTQHFPQQHVHHGLRVRLLEVKDEVGVVKEVPNVRGSPNFGGEVLQCHLL